MSIQGSGGYPSPWPSQAELDGGISELGPLPEVGFEPQTRQRSYTWPRPDNYVDPNDDAGSKKNSNQNLAGAPPLPAALATKKNSSRRNAWGNLSYADLITQAITSAQDNRLTLSQIYEWMVQNVPYFKDKGDSNSSAGWKELRIILRSRLPIASEHDVFGPKLRSQEAAKRKTYKFCVLVDSRRDREIWKNGK